MNTIDYQFTRFNRENPDVYRRLVEMAMQLHDRGRTKIGIGMLFEVLRWETMMRTEDLTSSFKLNNNYRSRYARLIMRSYPELDGIFNLREIRS